MKRKASFVFFLFLIAGSSSGQDSRWTFRQCLDTALKRNISVNETRLSNELNRISLEQSKANRFPSLSAGANEGVNFGKNVDPLTNAFVVQTYNSTSFSVNAGWNLFNGLQNKRTIQQNTLAIEAGKYDVANAENTITLNITTAYLQVLFAYEILAAAENQAAATAGQVEMTEKMVNAGKLPESNLFQIRSQYATDKLSVVNAQNQLDMARVTLLQLMEVPVTDSFDVEKPELAEPSEILLKPKEDLFSKALSVQPQIAGAAVRSQSALLGIKKTEGARWPRLNLTGNLNTDFATSTRETEGSGVNPYKIPFFEQLWNNIGSGVGLSISIPIYSNRQIKSSIEQARINAMTAKLNEQNIKNQLRKSIEQTYTDLKNSMKKYEATKEQFISSEVSYKNTETKYTLGLVTAIDFLVEKNNYFQAQSNLIQAKYDYVFKNKILDFYVGTPITF